jgi:hypothetical protein
MWYEEEGLKKIRYIHVFQLFFMKQAEHNQYAGNKLQDYAKP